MKLNQCIAVEKGVKSKANAQKSELYKLAQKPALFDGFAKKYLPKREGEEVYPPESKLVQFQVPRVLDQVAACVTALLDVEATKDYANCGALADVVVDGVVLVKQAPVTFLLNLEKELNDLHAFVGALPVLDPADEWQKDANSGLFRTQPTQTIRTKKVQKAIVLYPATEQHPAQTQLIVEDELVGFWEQTKVSGAVPEPRRRELLAKVEKLQAAVKVAREQANMADAPDVAVGGAVTAWLFS